MCTKPLPCQPTHFWNDENGSKYRKAYFSKFPGRSQGMAQVGPLRQALADQKLSCQVSVHGHVPWCRKAQAALGAVLAGSWAELQVWLGEGSWWIQMASAGLVSSCLPMHLAAGSLSHRWMPADAGASPPSRGVLGLPAPAELMSELWAVHTL